LIGVKQFDQDQIVVGHNTDVHLDLDGEGVSPIHCLIEMRDGTYFISDLGSAGGTFKNGQAVLDEALTSGDKITIGQFELSFFVGVPKPVTIPTTGPSEHVPSTPIPPVTPVIPAAVVEPQTQTQIPIPPPVPEAKPEKKPEPTPALAPAAPIIERASIPMQAPRVETPKAEEKPAITAAPVRPVIRAQRSSTSKKKKSPTFAPPSEIKDLKTSLKPTKGTTVEVIVAWKERILTTYHFTGTRPVKVGAEEKQCVALPEGLAPKGFQLIDMAGGMKVNTTGDMKCELVSAMGTQNQDDLVRTGKAQKSGNGLAVKIEQSEMLCVNMPGGYMTLYIRYVPASTAVPLVPPLMLSGSEMTGLIMSLVMVALLALYISATVPKDWQENKQEDVQRLAQIVFDKPFPTPTPTPTPPPPEPKKPEVEAKPTPTPTPPKKVVVADNTKVAQTKNPKNAPKLEQKASTAARASEVAPKPLAKDRTKKFTSTRQGGAMKTGEQSAANAQSANKDLSKVGLFSAFGGGGARKNIDKAYSGAGEVLGMADKATGASGFNENRAGDDLGSKFKDTGAGGKGTATQGIAGIGTKGRGSGQSAYGAADGFGSKSQVAIEGGGMEESFDGTIDKEAIRRVIRSKLHEVKSCYERALNTQQKGSRLEGKIVLGWDIVAGGQARNVKVVSSTLGNSQVENCIRDRLASWVFPEPPAGLVAEVKAYPFVLNQAN
jgi:outer membrane biosynthesis protein TonB